VEVTFYRLDPSETFRIPKYLSPVYYWEWNHPNASRITRTRIPDAGDDWIYPPSNFINQHLWAENFKEQLAKSFEGPEHKYMVLWTYDTGDLIPPYHLGIILTDQHFCGAPYETIWTGHPLLSYVLVGETFPHAPLKLSTSTGLVGPPGIPGPVGACSGFTGPQGATGATAARQGVKNKFPTST